MDRKPIDIDDPRLTAYALGELAPHEVDEFERRLEFSPLAQRELEATLDMVGVLSSGLEREWNSRVEGFTPDSVDAAAEAVVVPGNFGSGGKRRHWAAAAAAACIAMVGVAALVGGRAPDQAGGSWAAADDAALENSIDEGTNEFRVPELLLAEEVAGTDFWTGEDRGSLLTARADAVDASYLDAGHVIRTSHRPAAGDLDGAEHGTFRLEDLGDRVDSYLQLSTPGGSDSVRRQEAGVLEEAARLVSTLLSEGDSPVLADFAGVPSGSQQDRLASEARDMNHALSEISGELNRIEGSATPQQIERLRKQVDQAVQRSRSLADRLSGAQ